MVTLHAKCLQDNKDLHFFCLKNIVATLNCEHCMIHYYEMWAVYIVTSPTVTHYGRSKWDMPDHENNHPVWAII